MKITDLFEVHYIAERLASPVYINDAKTLHLVNNLIQKEFGLPKYDGSGGMCFLTQFVYSIASATGIDAATISKVFTKQTDYLTGHSLKDLLDFFQSVEIPDGDKVHKLTLSFEKFKNVNDIIKSIKEGIPVTMITHADHPMYDELSDIGFSSENDEKHPGEVLKRLGGQHILKYNHKIFHALLLVGYDSKFDLLIGRESRSSYGYKGYFRFKSKNLKPRFNHFVFLSIIVDDIKTMTKPKPTEPRVRS